MHDDAIIYVVDDDAAVRDAIAKLVQSVGLSSMCYSSAEIFLEEFDNSSSSCLVLDVRMSGIGGLELLQIMNDRNYIIPTIIITGHGDIPMAVEALHNGAMNFIEKPFRNQVLLDAITSAIRESKKLRDIDGKNKELLSLYSSLTERELEVSACIAQGMASKQIANELCLSPRTVETHRANIMKKMNSTNAFELLTKLIYITNLKRPVAVKLI